MEFIKSCLVDFVLFSGIEGIIFCLFFEKIGGFKKFKWWQWLILSIGNCLISKIFPPLIYQIIAIFWMSIVIYKINKIKFNKVLFITFISSILIMIIEMLFALCYEFFIKIDLFNVEIINLFIRMIPIRIIEVLLLFLFGGDKMKMWLGSIKKRK